MVPLQPSDHRKSVTLRFTLTTATTVLIVLVSALIFTVGYVGSTRSILLLSKNLTSEVSRSIREKISVLLTSAEKANAQIGFLISNKIIDSDDKQRLMDLAFRYMKDNEGFTSVDIGNVLGNKYKAERMPDNSVSRRSYVRDDKHVSMTWYHEDPDNKDLYKDKVDGLKTGYDPRTRPWWISAVTNGKASWTDVYVSGTRKQFVYSCAAPIFAEDGKLVSVSSIDINIVTLSEFLGTLQIFEHGRAFILNSKNQVIGIPLSGEADLDSLVKKSPEGSNNRYELYPLHELPDTNIREAVTFWLDRRTDGTTQADFEFKGNDGVPYLVHMVDFPYKPDSNFTIGIIIPRDDVLGIVNRNSMIVFALIAVCFIVSVMVGILVSRRISRSLSKLATEVNKVSRLELDSNEVTLSRISEVAKISNSVENMKKGLRSFKKYVPADLVRQLNEMQKEAVLGGEKRVLSIFFSDIADFTSISEQLSPEVLVENLGIYFHGMSQTILQNGGTLDKYIGDAIMAFWGAPVNRTNHASLACATALKCRKYLDQLTMEFTGAGKPLLNTRIGIHTGDVIVGNIGYEERLNYTIIGDNVNLASRIEGLNKYYGTRIIISDETLAQVAGEFVTRRLDVVAVKGKSQGVGIHELMGAPDDLAQDRLEFIRTYNHAMEMYLSRQWQEALPIFQEALRKSGGTDPASGMMVQRCTEYMAKPPQNDWNGVYAFHSK